MLQGKIPERLYISFQLDQVTISEAYILRLNLHVRKVNND